MSESCESTLLAGPGLRALVFVLWRVRGKVSVEFVATVTGVCARVMHLASVKVFDLGIGPLFRMRAMLLGCRSRVSTLGKVEVIRTWSFGQFP